MKTDAAPEPNGDAGVDAADGRSTLDLRQLLHVLQAVFPAT